MRSRALSTRVLAALLHVVVPLSLGGCYLAAGLGEFGPAGEGGEGGTSQAKGTSTRSSGETTGSGGAPPGCDHVLITEIRTAGGDFVELYNPTSMPVELQGWTLTGLTESGMPRVKWTGVGGQVIQPDAYFVLGVAQPYDAEMEGFAYEGIAVAQLMGPSGVSDLVDVVCVCNLSACMAPGFGDACTRALIIPDFTSRDRTASAQRRDRCADTDATSADFVDACPTPDADLSEAALMCP